MPFIHNEDEHPVGLWMTPAPFVEDCQACAFEAYERMTDGGLGFTAPEATIVSHATGIIPAWWWGWSTVHVAR
jgi:hypothetical protein